MFEEVPDFGQLTDEQIQRGYAINSLLMAIDTQDAAIFGELLKEDPDKAAEQLMGAVFTLKSMVDSLLNEINVNVLEPMGDNPVEFRDLVSNMAEILMQVESHK